MLHEFIAANRDAIIWRTRTRVVSRPWPSVSTDEIEYGVPLFLTQLSETLRLEATETVFPPGAIGSTAARHGAELLGRGFTVSQVVHDYGDICQAITELAVEQNAPVTVEEFHILNRSLDTAIAEAVTEHARITAQTRSAEEAERVVQAAHELRDILNSALLAYQMLKKGSVAINGFTGAVLGRSLMSLRHVIDGTLTEVRLAAGRPQRERLALVTLLDEIAATGLLHSEYRDIQFTVERVDPKLAVHGDSQLLTSAVMNLLHNAFKNTPSGGRVVLRAHAEGRHLIVAVEDECGGIPESKGDLFQAFGDQRGRDGSGLDLGLSIARKAIRALGGDILIRNMPGKGCIFMIELPLAADDVRAPQSVAV